jgi:hypothetical protein
LEITPRNVEAQSESPGDHYGNKRCAKLHICRFTWKDDDMPNAILLSSGSEDVAQRAFDELDDGTRLSNLFVWTCRVLSELNRVTRAATPKLQ